MRRIFAVAFLSVLLVAVSPAFAQRGGHAAGFGGGHVGGSGLSGHSFGGGLSSGSFGRSSGFAPHSFAGAPQFTSTAPSRAFVPGYRTPYGGMTATRRPDGGERGDYRYRSPYRGYGGYPYYANSWEVLPWDLGYSDFTGYNGYDSGDAQQQPVASVAPPDDGYRQNYVEPGYESGYQPGYPAAPANVADSVAAEPQLMLIFNDGHQEGIHNYVLTSDAVIVLDQAASGRQQRIPLAALNLPATEQAAEQSGLDFTPPA
jgi:hypothetical protein